MVGACPIFRQPVRPGPRQQGKFDVHRSGREFERRDADAGRQGIFQVADPTQTYTVWVGTNNGAQWSQVLYDQDVITNGATIYSGKFVFGSEDGSDNDYNDSYLQLQWFQFNG